MGRGTEWHEGVCLFDAWPLRLALARQFVEKHLLLIILVIQFIGKRVRPRIRDQLQRPRIAQVFVHGTLHLLYLLIQVLMLLRQLLNLLEGRLEQLFDTHGGELGEAQIGQELPKHGLIFVVRAAHFLVEERLGALVLE